MKFCKPLDLLTIRLSLRDGMSLKSMGELIPSYFRACPYAIIAESRIQDWELGRRSVPEYVYFAYAAIVADDWACDRHEAPSADHVDIDCRYGNMLNPGFGELLKLEHHVLQSTDPSLLAIAPSLVMQRHNWTQHFKNLFGLDMEHVWVENLEDLFT